VLVVFNFTPVPRYNYRVGVPQGGRWREILNSDADLYGGSGMGNQGGADAQPMPYEDLHHSLTLTLPPLAVLVFKPE
jgi:1,4-alpha-glucan branching enzyme